MPETRTTRFEYNLEGNLRKLIAENVATGDQVTEWIYGVTAAQGSKLESNSLLYQKVYPDSTGAADRVTCQYNRQGQFIAMKDQAGTRHSYSFDKFGRLTEDRAAEFGSGVDSTVRKIRRSYEVRGMLEKVGSFGTGATPLNEVELAYNGYSQLAADSQAHSGAVDPGTTPEVAYSYADGSGNTVRRTGMTYPDGTTELTIAYDGSAADALSRPDALKEGGSTLCSYRYLGAGTVVGVKYDAASDVEMTYRDGGTGEAGDPYTGLDRFGRLVETLWKKGSADQVRSKYGRNRFSGVVWRRDEEAHAQSVATEDNYYWYDGLYQVTEHQRGELTASTPGYSGIVSPPQQGEHWQFDETGNWEQKDTSAPDPSETEIGTATNIQSDGFDFGHLTGTPVVGVGSEVKVGSTVFVLTEVQISSPQNPPTEDSYYQVKVAESTAGIADGEPVLAHGSITLEQSRTHNEANEITDITSAVGSVTPDYDPVGNMTTLPKAPGTETGQYTLRWDAWNRLVEVKDGGTVVAAYAYDGFTRRLTKTNATETRHYYYNDQWRTLEERADGASVLVDRQYTWGIFDRWDMLRRKRSTGGSSLNETHFVLRDFADPVAIVGTDGAVVERYGYDAFGNVRFFAPDLTNRSSSDFDWEFLFHSEFRDADTGLYNYGYRYYDTGLGRWPSRDPMGEEGHELTKEASSLAFAERFDSSGAFEATPTPDYQLAYELNAAAHGGLNRYGFCFNDPLNYIDSLGENPVLIARALAALRAARAAAAAAAKKTARKIAECEAIHQAYKAVEKNCRGCNANTPGAEATKQCACWSAVLAGRSLYISKKCDYILPGSIARGSKVAENGHKGEYAKLALTAARCCFCKNP